MKSRVRKVKISRRDSKSERSGASKILLTILKGSLIALCFTMLGILIFAFILKFTNIPESVIAPVNQVIKGASVFLGVFIGLKKSKEMGLVSGLMIGLIYTLVAFTVFSVLDGGFCFDKRLLNDTLFGGVMGAICGIICVNIKKSTT